MTSPSHSQGRLAETKVAGIISAFRIVDWLRLADHSVSSEELSRLVAVVERYHRPALKDLCESLHPAHSLLWDGLNIVSRFSQLRNE
jgi:nucleolar pre-ribosomal-associated protein 1